MGVRSRLAENHVLIEGLQVAHELAIKDRSCKAGHIGTEGSSVSEIGGEAGILEFDRKEERRRDMDALDLDALLVGAAGGDLVNPEGEPARVGLAIQEVEVMLANEERSFVDRVGRGSAGIVVDDCISARLGETNPGPSPLRWDY